MGDRSLPVDWNEIFRRCISGETMASLAKEFGVSLSAVKARAVKENWGVSRLHDNPTAKAQRQQLAALLQTDSAEFLSFASTTTRHAMAEVVQNLTLHFHRLPPAQLATTRKIIAFTSLLKAAAVLFDWQPRQSLALHAHLHRRSSPDQINGAHPSYFDLNQLPVSSVAPGSASETAQLQPDS